MSPWGRRGPRALPSPCLPSGRNSVSLFSKPSEGLLRAAGELGGDAAQFQRGKCGKGAVRPFLALLGLCEPRQDTGMGEAQAWAWKPAVLRVLGVWGLSTHSLMLSGPAWDSCTCHSHRELP